MRLWLHSRSADLLVQFSETESIKILGQAVRIAENLKCAYGKVIYMDVDSDSFDITTDETLLNRVLINMLTNALEASEVGDRVTAGVKLVGGLAMFWVQNSQIIPEEYKHKIFVKSFTTKKRGSGLGTHSIKTLTERYLKGTASFVTGEGIGTIFRITLPLR